jgi:Carboxypeptidase regulatory-like domain
MVMAVHRVFRGRRALAYARTILVWGMCLLVAAIGRAQHASGPASITGRVVDQQGGVLPETTVILLNGNASIRLQQTKTGQDGAFAFENLAPGDYVVEAERTGFTQAEKKVTITAGQPQESLSLQMKVAGPGQQVTVTAEANSFTTDESSTATKINIPLNEIPQGVGVTNQALIQSQQDTYFADAAENISGVNRDVLLAGDVGNALTIRGLPLGSRTSDPTATWVC